MNKLMVVLGLLVVTPASIAFADEPKKEEAPKKDFDLKAYGARMVPSMKDGKPQGLKLYAIVKGMRVDEAGFENGDTVISVDGDAVVETKGLMALGSKVLDAKSDAVVEIIRKGVTTKLTTKAKH